MIVNILLSILKVVVGILACSQSLVADGFHSISDLISDAVILVGSKFWLSPPDQTHPYGHGRIETIVNVIIGVLLGGVGIGIGWNAIKTLGVTHLAPPGWVAFYVAVVSIISKELIYRITVFEGRRINSSAVIANAWHHRSDAFSSIPVAVAVIGSKINPDLLYLDHIAALIVTAMILKAACSIIVPSIRELTESCSDHSLEERIILLGKKIPEIKEIHKIRSRHVGSSILMDMHLLFEPKMSIEEAHTIAESFNKKILNSENNLAEVIIHIEPYYEQD